MLIIPVLFQPTVYYIHSFKNYGLIFRVCTGSLALKRYRYRFNLDPRLSNARYSRLTLRIGTALAYTGTVSWALYVTFSWYNGIILHINVSYTKSIYAECRFNPVKIGTALNTRGLHWKIELVSLYLILNCFVMVRYFFCVL
jgi:hypothetical protein